MPVIIGDLDITETPPGAPATATPQPAATAAPRAPDPVELLLRAAERRARSRAC